MVIHESGSEDDTHRIARDLAASLDERVPATVLLYGELGAGKTAFVRGLVDGAGGSPDEVSSPTFVLAQEYAGRRTVHHVDLYRLSGMETAAFEPQLFELAAGDAIVAVEWADRLLTVPAGAIQVRIEDCGGDDRTVTISSSPDSSGLPL